MRHATQPATPNPFDVSAMLNLNAMVPEPAAGAYRAWLDCATQMQAEATGFWNARFGKDAAAFAALGACTNPEESIALQMRYAQDAVADYIDEGRRMIDLLSEAAGAGGAPGLGHTRPANKTA